MALKKRIDKTIEKVGEFVSPSQAEAKRKIEESKQKQIDFSEQQKQVASQPELEKALEDRPLTREERVSAGNQFIREREKAISQGATKDEAAKIAEQQTQGVTGRTRTVQEVQERNRALQQIAGQVGNFQQLPADLESIFAPSALAGAGITGGLSAGGGIAGSLLAGGTLTAGATLGGAIGGAGLLAKLISEQREAVSVDLATVYGNNGAIDRMTAIVNGANKGLIDPITAVTLFNRELAIIDQAERKLKARTQSDVRNFLGSPAKELTRVQNFNQFERGFLIQQMQQSIQAPNINTQLQPQSTEQEI